MVRCPTEPDLERYLQGRCSSSESSSIRTHEAGCPTCAGWLEQARADESLLSNLRRAHSSSAGPGAADLEEEPALARYRIVRRLGAGGMGVVYEAEQRSPRRPVALKVLASSFPSDRALRRFERETEVLGRLVHPGIAQIFEAGMYASSLDRRPFFAMELVDGLALVGYADQRGLTTPQRIRLLIPVCDAVQHAHQKGVLHRDLKPANILVTPEGQPKILDFGVARSVDPELESATARTDAAEIVGTLPYMSPEQLAGDPLEVDTRSDVYALGVLLYELLTGRLPFRITGRSILDAARVIEQQRAEPLGAIDARLAGDLETIAATALEKDKSRRYGSAEALAADLRHFLAREPISARPPSAGYHLGMFARRNRGVVAGLTLAFVALAAGIVATSRQAARARTAETAARESEQEALAQAETASETGRFLKALIGFDDADPAGVARSGDTTMREVLSDAGGLLTGNPFSNPAAEAEIRVAIGNAQRRFGLRVEAVGTLERALELRLGAHGEDDPSVAGTLNTLGVARYASGDVDGAIADWRRALAIYRALGSDEPEKEATTLGNLAAALTGLGQLERAESMLLETLAVHERELGPETLHVASDLRQLAKLRLAQGRAEEALGHLTRSLEIVEALDADHPQAVITASALLESLRGLGRFEEAEPIARDFARRTARVHGEGSSQWADAQNNLALVLDRLGRWEEALDPAVRAVEAYRDLSVQPRLAYALYLQSRILVRAADDSAAEAPMREAVELFSEVLGADHVDTASGKVDLGQLLVRTDRDAEAAPLFREAIDRLRGERVGRSACARAATELAAILSRDDPHAQGLEDLHRTALRALDDLPRTSHRELRCATLDHYGAYLVTVGGPDRLEQGRELLRASLELSLEVHGEHAPETATIRGHLARAEALPGSDG